LCGTGGMRRPICVRELREEERDRLIRLAATHPTWALGFQDEVWWSRLARPSLHAWIEEDERRRLVEQTVAKDDPDPKALACYGVLLRADPTDEDAADQRWLRFVDGRPVSAVTIDDLDWCCRKLQAAGREALVLIWDNAAWHVSHQVRDWIRDHNRQVKHDGDGVRFIAYHLLQRGTDYQDLGPWYFEQRDRDALERRLVSRLEALGNKVSLEKVDRVA
jgi:hypothetical protein